MKRKKFLKITKQKRFRGLKTKKDSMKSLINNILYKLNILNKYSFIDVTKDQVFYPFKIFDIENDFIRAKISFRLLEEKEIYKEYLHKKRDERNVVEVLHESFKSILIVESYLDFIEVKIPSSDIWYKENEFPVIILNDNYSCSEYEVEKRRMYFDFNKLKNLKCFYETSSKPFSYSEILVSEPIKNLIEKEAVPILKECMEKELSYFQFKDFLKVIPPQGVLTQKK